MWCAKRTLKAALFWLILGLALCLAGMGEAATYTYKFPVRQSSDDVDVYRAAGYWPPNNSSPLTAVTMGLGRSTSLVQGEGIRVGPVRIPRGSTILSAKLKVFMNSTSGTNAEETIMVGFEQADNPETYATSGARSPMTLIPAFIAAGEPQATAWALGVYTGSTWRYSPDLSAGLQAIIDRPGWVQDNFVSVLIYPQVRTAFDDGPTHAIWSFDKVVTYARFPPTLVVTFESATAPVTRTYYLDSNAPDGGDGLSDATAWNDLLDVPITVGMHDNIMTKAGSSFSGLLELFTGINFIKYGDGADPLLTGNGTGVASVCVTNNGASPWFDRFQFSTARGGIQSLGNAYNPRFTNCSFTNPYFGIYLASSEKGYDHTDTRTDEAVTLPTILNFSSIGANAGATAGGDIRLGGSIKQLYIDTTYHYDGVDPIVAAASTEGNLDVPVEDWIIRNVRAHHMKENVGLDAKGLMFPSYEKGLLVTDWEGWDDYDSDISGPYGGFSIHIGNSYHTYNRIYLHDLVGPGFSIHDDDDTGTKVGTNLTEYIRGSNIVVANGAERGFWVDDTIEGPLDFRYFTLANLAGYGLSLSGRAAAQSPYNFSDGILYNVGTANSAANVVSYALDESKITLARLINWNPTNSSFPSWYASNVTNNGYEALTDAQAMGRFGTWTNLWNLDPMLVNPAAGNFRLRPNSPARDAGVAVSWRTGDFEGRPQIGTGWDVGAYEWYNPRPYYPGASGPLH